MEDQQIIKRPSGPRNLERSFESPESDLYNYDTDLDSDDHLRFSDYWRALRKRLLLIVGIAVLVTLSAAIYMARQPDIYQAKARVQVNLETNPALGDSRTGPVVIAGDPAYFNTQLLILSGPALLQRVVKTLRLEEYPSFLRPQSGQNLSTRQSLLRMIGGGPKNLEEKKQPTHIPLTVAPAATAQEDMGEAQRLAPYVAAIQNGLEVKLVESTRLITIGFKHPDREISALVVNAIADTYVASNLEKKTQTNTGAGDFIQKRIAELQDQIRRGEVDLIEYGNSNQILSLDPSQNTVIARLGELNRQLAQAENQRKLAEAAYQTALTPGAADVLAEGTSQRAIADEGLLSGFRMRRAQLLVEHGEEWPEVKELDRQIGELEKNVVESREKAKSLMIAKLETAYRQSVASENIIRSAYDKQRSETVTQNEAAINYRMIQQEIATNKGLLDGLLKRSKENDVILAGMPNNIYVLDYAIVPSGPVAPQRWQVVGLALLFSLAFGIGTAILLEQLDNTKPIRTVSQVDKILHLDTLAAVPSAKGLVWRRKIHAIKSLVGSNGNGNGNGNQALVLNSDIRSPLVEAYGMLRTSLLLSSQNAARTLLVTSSLPGEGKTTTAINTALLLARTGAKVLLIDADLRHPQIDSVFKIENKRGVSTILSIEMNDAEMTAMIEQDEESGLYLLPSGPVPPNPSELLSSENLGRLIANFESAFTYVIVDSPPVAYFTDSVLISSVVQGVLLVVHASSCSREIVQGTQRQLNGVGANIIGVILNQVNPPRHEYRYYKHYYGKVSSN
jgi:succinoglycan biosynthesis transport protein ExoP